MSQVGLQQNLDQAVQTARNDFRIKSFELDLLCTEHAEIATFGLVCGSLLAYHMTARRIEAIAQLQTEGIVASFAAGFSATLQSMQEILSASGESDLKALESIREKTKTAALKLDPFLKDFCSRPSVVRLGWGVQPYYDCGSEQCVSGACRTM